MSRHSFSKDDFNSMMKQFDQTLQRSTQMASEAHQINQMQGKEIRQYQTALDHTDEHLQHVEQQIEEIQRGFCCQLCCSSKPSSKKSKLKHRRFHPNRSRVESFALEEDSIVTNDQLKMIDENLQKMQHFNRLIDAELQDQIETLHSLQAHVDHENRRLDRANAMTKRLR